MSKKSKLFLLVQAATLRRIRVPGHLGDGGVYHEGYTYYETRDGRFQVKRERTPHGEWWVASATDGSSPFNYHGANIETFRGSTLDECRYQIEMVIERLVLAYQGSVDWYREVMDKNESELEMRRWVMNDIKRAKLKRITVPGHLGDGGVYFASYTYYETPDGRFKVDRIWMTGGGVWQVKAMDGSRPFTTVIGGIASKTSYFNADTLTECREEIASVCEDEEHEHE